MAPRHQLARPGTQVEQLHTRGADATLGCRTTRHTALYGESLLPVQVMRDDGPPYAYHIDTLSRQGHIEGHKNFLVSHNGLRRWHRYNDSNLEA